MANREKTLTGYTFVVNIIQILLCFVIFFLRKFNAAGFIVTQGVLFAAEILIWFICGITFALGLNIRKMKYGFLYSLIALLPIILITGICAALGFSVNDTGASGWSKYFFFGGAVNFWHRPAVFLSVLIKNSAYLIYAVNIAILFCASLIGVNYGIILNISKQKKAKKRIKKVTREKPAKLKADETAEPENILPAEIIEAATETTEQKQMENEQTSEDNGLKESKV